MAGAWLLAVNFTWVMYSRVALLEATMVAVLVASWACYARAERDWRWGFAAGFGLLAFFTKASAAFFLIALGLDACWVGWRAWRAGGGVSGPAVAGAAATFAGLGVGTLALLAVFVVPQWERYSFYNLFVYGSRRSSVGAGPLLDRASWFPVVHGSSHDSGCSVSRRWQGWRRCSCDIVVPRPASAFWRCGSCWARLSSSCTTWATSGATSF